MTTAPATAQGQSRVAAVAAALGIEVLLVAALIFGLRTRLAAPADAAMQVFAVAPSPPPPPRVVPPHARQPRPQGRAAPPARRAKAAAIVAPVPVVLIAPPPPPVVTAVVAGAGAQASPGAAVAGPGSGAGGQGDGTGSGGAGNGDGGGGEIPLRRIRGHIGDPGDYPPAALAAGISGVTYMRFGVGIDGRVHDCRVTRSSGNAELDAATCRLITERFRYKPTRDPRGRKVPDTVTGEQHWEARRVEQIDDDAARFR